MNFIDKCKRGHTIEETTEIFIKDYERELNDENDVPSFWYALTDIQWKYGKLLPKVKENALYHIEELKKKYMMNLTKLMQRREKNIRSA